MDATSILSLPLTWVAIGTSVLYSIYKYGTSTFNYFSNQGIPGPKPLPFVGNTWGIWRENLPKYDVALVKKYGKTFGYFDGRLPNLFTTDVDLIRTVFVKDFENFFNRRDFVINSRVNRKMMSIMRGQEWKDVRSSVTPAFTTGKIKRMSTLITECANRLAVKFNKIAKDEGKVDAKIVFSAFTMDVIARCAFGLTIQNLGEKGDPFMDNAKKIFNSDANRTPLIILPFTFPQILARFNETLFFSKEFRFFIDVVENMVNERKTSKQKFHDFIEVATESVMNHTKEVDGKSVAMFDKEEVDEIIIAQSTLFLLAGFDTTATSLTNSIFMLARNPDVQEKLYNEILTKMEEHDEINHEMILDFPYVDNVIHEVLRMNPPVPRVERECNKDVTYNNIKIKKGTVVTVPCFPLHYDPDYYPEPEVFNPDRWSAENKSSMTNSNAYMPFGMGPRNCVGMRFAMEEIKIVLCTIVKNFRFFPVAETPEKMEFEDGFLQISQPIHATVGIEVREQ